MFANDSRMLATIVQTFFAKYRILICICSKAVACEKQIIEVDLVVNTL